MPLLLPMLLLMLPTDSVCGEKRAEGVGRPLVLLLLLVLWRCMRDAKKCWSSHVRERAKMEWRQDCECRPVVCVCGGEKRIYGDESERQRVSE